MRTDFTWEEIQPSMKELAERELTEGDLDGWLGDWSRIISLIEETSSRLRVAASIDTSDKRAEKLYLDFEEKVHSPARARNQQIKQNLLRSGLKAPPGFEIPLKNMKAESELFREENLPLMNEENRLESEYNRTVGSQTVRWEGEEVTLNQLNAKLSSPDRDIRKRAWSLKVERQLADRDAIGKLWAELVALRHRMALNAGLEDYRAYHWQDARRFDYTPEDCLSFHDAVLKVATPAVARIYERRRMQMGLETLRPWDLDADPLGRTPLEPFNSVDELEEKTGAILNRVAPEFGRYFDTMRSEGLLDLGNRKNKAPHAWCTGYEMVQRPFIFMNATGRQRDVMTLLHEAGHAFHLFEMARLPYIQQRDPPAEFAEVASMAMELLAAPYLAIAEGGFYSEADAARARIRHLEDALVVSWPYCVAMDLFQHWVYANPDVSVDPEACGARWVEIWLDFMPLVDWTGLEDALANAWQYVPHFFEWPFYAIEYSIARLGSVQIWQNAMEDQARAVSQYRKALSLGCTVPLGDLYQAAGARLAFDASTLGEAVRVMEATIAKLSS